MKKTISKGAISKELLENIEKYGFSKNDVCRCSKFSVYGTVYQRGKFVILKRHPSDFPFSYRFAKIEELLCIKEDPYLLIKEVIAYYEDESDLFIIDENKDFNLDIVSWKNLGGYLPLNAYHVGEQKKLSLSLKFHTLDSF